MTHQMGQVKEVRFVVGAKLKKHRISVYRLSKTSGISLGTAYALANGTLSGVAFETLDRVRNALESLTGKTFTPNDLLEVVRDGKN